MNKFLLLLILNLFPAPGNNSGLKIKVEPINKNQLSSLIEERNGKILLLNLWATWCIPCREEFPDLIKISNEYKNKNVEVIGISIDFPDEVKSKIIPFLQKQKANFINYVNGFDNDEKLINLINEKWSGAIPSTAVYDSSGRQISFLEGKKSYKEFKDELEKALKK